MKFVLVLAELVANDVHRSAGSISRKLLLAEAAEELRRFVACFLTVGEKAGDDHTGCLESSLGGIPDVWLDCTLARTCGDDNKMTELNRSKKSSCTGTVRREGPNRISDTEGTVSRIPYPVPAYPAPPSRNACNPLIDGRGGRRRMRGVCWTWLSARRSGEGGHLLEKGMPLGIYSMSLKHS
jgi:hypothetical protein